MKPGGGDERTVLILLAGLAAFGIALALLASRVRPTRAGRRYDLRATAAVASPATAVSGVKTNRSTRLVDTTLPAVLSAM